MCDLQNPLEGARSFTGWKVVLVHKESGRMYSPATGVEYVAGQPVQAHSGIAKLRSMIFNHDICCEEISECYQHGMAGKTCVFACKGDAGEEFRSLSKYAVVKHDDEKDAYAQTEEYELAVVKMTLSRKLWEGTYGFRDKPVVGGEFIRKIEPAG